MQFQCLINSVIMKVLLLKSLPIAFLYILSEYFESYHWSMFQKFKKVLVKASYIYDWRELYLFLESMGGLPSELLTYWKYLFDAQIFWTTLEYLLSCFSCLSWFCLRCKCIWSNICGIHRDSLLLSLELS